MATRSDVELLLRYRDAGDRDALTELFQRRQGLVYRIAWNELGNTAEAEDAAQEAFLSLLRYAPHVQEGDSLAGLLARMALLASRRLSRMRRRREARESAWWATHTGATPSDVAQQAVEQTLVREALQALPEGYRKPIMLRYLHGLSTEETAQALGITHGAARMRLSRGIERLRKRLALPGTAVTTAVALTALEQSGMAVSALAPSAALLAGLEAAISTVATTGTAVTTAGGLGLGVVAIKTAIATLVVASAIVGTGLWWQQVQGGKPRMIPLATSPVVNRIPTPSSDNNRTHSGADARSISGLQQQMQGGQGMKPLPWRLLLR
jgi:RNA polymerase sigma factor (sigma-70 family)